MCGIFAVSGTTLDAGTLVQEGLKKLEYRGYDSWGIGVRTASGNMRITKKTGKISGVNGTYPQGGDALGHTRWATHGKVMTKNAHPHRVGKVTVVHNGIVENFEPLKKKLSKKYTFASDTDSEVIAALIDNQLTKKTTGAAAIAKALKHIEGRYALVCMIDDDSRIYAARAGSPLIIGRTDTDTYIASDIPAFLEHTRTVNYLDDGDLAIVEKKNVSFVSLKNGASMKKRNVIVPWEIEEAEKGEWPHFMLKEIFEQRDTIIRAANQERATFEAFARILKRSKGVYVIGSGTAHKAAMVGEYFFAHIASRKINVVPAAEMPAFEPFIQKNTALIAISQSGETADVLEILERGKKKGAKIVSIVNVESSSMARMSDVTIPLNAGPEKAVASTKAMTAQMALLLLSAYADSSTSPNTTTRRVNRGRNTLRIAAANINDMLNPRYAAHVRTLAKKIAKHDDLFIIGRDTLYPIALEAAIKIQEVSYIHAQGFAAGELKHGPIALITKNTPVVVLGDDPETISNAIELASRGATIIGIANENHSVFKHWIRVPECGCAQAIFSVIPIQLLAYYLAEARGLDPDKPRNLAKSVTVK